MLTIREKVKNKIARRAKKLAEQALQAQPVGITEIPVLIPPPDIMLLTIVTSEEPEDE